MKTAYSLLTLLSVSLVAAGPLPSNRNDILVKRMEAVMEASNATSSVTAAYVPITIPS